MTARSPTEPLAALSADSRIEGRVPAHRILTCEDDSNSEKIVLVDTLALLLHPVRLRIVHAMSGGRVRTTSDLCDCLPDVSKATIYRHVGLLVEGGLLEVAGERRVHGAVERRFRLSRARPAIDRNRAGTMSLDEHRQGFVTAVAALVAEFNGYLDREHANPTDDWVGYRQLPLWLSREEVARLISEQTRIIRPLMGNQPSPDRHLYLMSPILFPIEEPPRAVSDEHADAPVESHP